MIGDKFEHVEELDDESRCLLRCRGCDAEFEANFDLLRPKNVSYELGTNLVMTVKCPECDAAVDTTQREVNIMYLTALADMMRAKLATLLPQVESKFTISDDRYSATFAYFKCLSCDNTFEARHGNHPDGPLNVVVDRKEKKLAVICPHCGSNDEINEGNEALRRELSCTAEGLRIVEEQIRELKEEEEDEEEREKDDDARNW